MTSYDPTVCHQQTLWETDVMKLKTYTQNAKLKMQFHCVLFLIKHALNMFLIVSPQRPMKGVFPAQCQESY